MAERTKPRRVISIRGRLFLYGFIPMIFAALIFSLILFTMTTRLIKQREETALISNTRILSGLLDGELSKMKRVSLNLSYSRRLKKAVQKYEAMKKRESRPDELYYAVREIQTILDETVGPLKQVPQVNIILPDGDMICFGRYNLRKQLPEHLMPRIRRFYNQKKTSWWSAAERDYLAEEQDPRPGRYISHYQVLFDPYRNPLGYIEVKQDSETLFVERLKAMDEEFQVFNNQNQQLYPLTLPYGSSYSLITSQILPYRILHRHNEGDQEKEVLCMGIATEASWRIITYRSEDSYMAPVLRIQLILIPLSLLIAFLGFQMSHQLSRGITTPLSRLNRKLNQFQWERNNEPGDNEPDSTGFHELDALELSFTEMNRKMDEKLDLFVAEKTLEVNARMLALQSQMDPHFLFNMLSIIDIMAEEGQNDEIQKVIRHLSTLLRYVSTLKETTVPLTEELAMAEHYMKCIAFRFDDSVEFITKLSDDIGELRIPKYSIIPLLENAVKYGMPSQPPCRITLGIEAKDGRWTVTVEDNGPGFTEEKLNTLLDRIQEGIREPRQQLENHINGMGLFNICARYSLLYGDRFLFDAENRTEGGARIRLGGEINVS